MDDPSRKRDYHHPYEPYDIQVHFMNAVYDCLENQQVGIFESPTGTGKSLSLICASMTWLREHQRQIFEDGVKLDATDQDEPAWMLEHSRKIKQQLALQRREKLEAGIAKIKAEEKHSHRGHQNAEHQSKRQKTALDTQDVDEAHFVLPDYDSDGEDVKNHVFGESGLSVENQMLMDQLGLSIKVREDDDILVNEPKIFYCSRTHSQLSQFASELRRVQLPPSVITNEDITNVDQDVKYLTLGSRKNLCINPKVSRLRNATAINERCLELQQSNVSQDCKCSFLSNAKDGGLAGDFRDHVLAKVRDIEDLALLGKKIGVCPYYASRPIVKHCEV
jgi:chromosome transmission fidelity protein 1